MTDGFRPIRVTAYARVKISMDIDARRRTPEFLDEMKRRLCDVPVGLALDSDIELREEEIR